MQLITQHCSDLYNYGIICRVQQALKSQNCLVTLVYSTQPEHKNAHTKTKTQKTNNGPGAVL